MLFRSGHLNQIKCPHCGEVFTIDESDYESIVRQIRDHEFEEDVRDMEKRIRKELDQAEKQYKRDMEQAEDQRKRELEQAREIHKKELDKS